MSERECRTFVLQGLGFLAGVWASLELLRPFLGRFA